jgi:D-3-phosphoglycerate dehydrogenase
MKKILLTTTSFQDTPGEHHQLLEKQGFEIVRERGPLKEATMLALAGQFDGFLCGDDAITRAVLEKSRPRLKVLSKYGIGLDKVDVNAATEFKIPVTFCPGVNHTTVAEHTLGLLLAVSRNIVTVNNHVKKGEWKRITGHELYGQSIGIVGMGRIGKEVAIRAKSFGMKLLGYGNYWDEDFAKEYNMQRMSLDKLIETADVISLHTKLTDETKHLINSDRLSRIKKGAIIINCGRGELVDSNAMVEALKSGHLYGYGADVMEEEPPPSDHPLFSCPNAIITSHIGSRTYESVIRQATMAAENLIRVLNGEKALAQANSF